METHNIINSFIKNHKTFKGNEPFKVQSKYNNQHKQNITSNTQNHRNKVEGKNNKTVVKKRKKQEKSNNEKIKVFP